MLLPLPLLVLILGIYVLVSYLFVKLYNVRQGHIPLCESVLFYTVMKLKG